MPRGGRRKEKEQGGEDGNRGCGGGESEGAYLAQQNVHTASNNDPEYIRNGVHVLRVPDLNRRVESVGHARDVRGDRNEESGEGGEVDAVPVVVETAGTEVVQLDDVVALLLDDPLRESRKAVSKGRGGA